MAQTVFILGAGASKEDGAPLLDEFLDVAYKLRNENASLKGDFERVFKAIAVLKGTHYKSYINLDNIEEVFGAIEMARIIGYLGSYSLKEIEEIRSSIKKVIVYTLERSIKLPCREEHIYATPVYDEFARLVMDAISGHPRLDCSIITFNYDMGLDYALHHRSVPIDYCLSEIAKPPKVKVLKLHGSLNWGKCECGAITPWNISSFFSKFHFDLWKDTKYVFLTIGTHIGKMIHCEGKKVTPEPLLIPPTWNKTEYHGQINKVWSQAAIELSEAENIFIIGYSMPESDLFFRYLYALSTTSDARLERLWIYNPDRMGDVQKRAERIKGSGIERRYGFIKEPFSSAIKTIRDALEVKAGRE